MSRQISFQTMLTSTQCVENLFDHKLSCNRASASAGYVFRSGMLSEWLENERNSMRFLNHLLCRPLRDLWTEDPPELKKRAGAARWRPTIRSALPCPALPCPALPALAQLHTKAQLEPRCLSVKNPGSWFAFNKCSNFVQHDFGVCRSREDQLP